MVICWGGLDRTGITVEETHWAAINHAGLQSGQCCKNFQQEAWYATISREWDLFSLPTTCPSLCLRGKLQSSLKCKVPGGNSQCDIYHVFLENETSNIVELFEGCRKTTTILRFKWLYRNKAVKFLRIICNTLRCTKIVTHVALQVWNTCTRLCNVICEVCMVYEGGSISVFEVSLDLHFGLQNLNCNAYLEKIICMECVKWTNVLNLFLFNGSGFISRQVCINDPLTYFSDPPGRTLHPWKLRLCPLHRFVLFRFCDRNH